MEFRDLEDHELRVFMGLFKLVVHADLEVSEPEREVIRALSAELGSARWNEAVAAARDAYPNIEDLEADARTVARSEAQHVIYDQLSVLAHADELVDGEAHVLRWVAQTWRLAHAEDEEDIDSFVLIPDDDGA